MKKVVLIKIVKEQRGKNVIERRQEIDSQIVDEENAFNTVRDFQDSADQLNISLERSGSWDRYEVEVYEADGELVQGADAVEWGN